MALQWLHRSGSYLKIHSPVIRCLPDVTQIGHPLLPAPSFLRNQYKFKAQLAEDSPGNTGTEHSTKPNLRNQLFPIALLRAILEQKRYDVDVQDVIHHFC